MKWWVIGAIIVGMMMPVGASGPTIQSVQWEIIDSEGEVGVFFCQAVIVGRFTGQNAIRVRQKDYWRMKQDCGYQDELIYVHNHPRPYLPAFSPQDIEAFAFWNLRAAYVVGYRDDKPYECWLIRPAAARYWPHSLVYNPVTGKTTSYYRKMLALYGAYRMWGEMFKQWGFEYGCGVLRNG